MACIICPSALGDPFYKKNLKARFPDLVFPDWPRNGKTSKSPEYLQQFCRVNFNRREIYIQPGVHGFNPNHLSWVGIMLRYDPGGDSSVAGQDFSGEQIAAIENIVSGNLLEYSSQRLGGEWLMQMGAVYQRQNRAALSRKMYQKALTLEPDNVNHRLLLAAGLTRDKRYKEGLKLVAEALQIDSRHPEALRLGQRIVKAMAQEKNLAAK
jgi:tetratricopeptide (TPR) repeat protein